MCLYVCLCVHVSMSPFGRAVHLSLAEACAQCYERRTSRKKRRGPRLQGIDEQAQETYIQMTDNSDKRQHFVDPIAEVKPMALYRRPTSVLEH